MSKHPHTGIHSREDLFPKFGEVADQICELLWVELRGEAVGHYGSTGFDGLRLAARDGFHGAGGCVADGDGIGCFSLLEAGEDGAVLHGDSGGFIAFLHVERGPDDFGDDHVHGQAARDAAEIGADLALRRTGRVAGDATGLFIDFFPLSGPTDGSGVTDDFGDSVLGVGGQSGIDAGEVHEERGDFAVTEADEV